MAKNTGTTRGSRGKLTLLVALMMAFSIVFSACGDVLPTFKVTVTVINGTITTSNANPKKGEDVTVTAKPAEGYAVDTFKVNGAYVEYETRDDGTFVYVIADVQADVDVEVAFFKKIVAPIITTESLPNGIVGVAYSQALIATGDKPITWSENIDYYSLGSSFLPYGLSLSGAGIISGTPTVAGTFTFTVKAANTAGNATKKFSITIVKDPDDSSDTRTRLYVGVYKAGFGTDWLEGIGGAYEAYNTDVKVSYIGDPGMQGTLMSAVATPNPRDIYSCTDSADLYNLATTDKLENLDDLYDTIVYGTTKFKDLVDPALDSMLKFNGSYYAVPWYGSVNGIIYNTKMFDQYGWEVPETMDDYYALCDTIKTQGIAPLTYLGSMCDGYMYNVFGGFFAQGTGPQALKTFFEYADPSVFDTTARSDAYEAISRMLSNQQWLLAGSNSFDNLTAQREFIKGNAAMLVCGSWLKTEMKEYLKDYPSFECAFMPLPWINPAKENAEGSQNGNLSDMTMLVIPKAAKNKEIAKDFLNFMSTKEMRRMYLDKTMGGSMRALKYDDVDLSGLDVWAQSVVDIYNSSTNLYPNASNHPLARTGLLNIILAGGGNGNTDILGLLRNATSVSDSQTKAMQLRSGDVSKATTLLA
ncbi:MAG: extracellular solute-binding protein [Firmicutes bacterium]|nr:extracellular solute-binding protein [Bacillota bacterium]